MPPMEEIDRHQKAVLWLFLGIDEFGTPTVDKDNPIELNVRWVQKREESVNARGDPIALEATVIVDREIPQHSLMWLGLLDDWNDTLEDQIMEVVQYDEVPDIRGRIVRQSVGVRRYRADLPSGATFSPFSQRSNADKQEGSKEDKK